MRICTILLLASLAYTSANAQTCENACGTHQHGEGFHIEHTAAGKSKANGNHYIGSMHEHSSFSDGSPGTSPADYYRTGKANGYDFVMGSEHSDNFIIPIGLHEDCASEKLLDCITINPMNPLEGIFKWGTTKTMTSTATTADFLAIRGFEWTSDRTGHINVYFSKNLTNAKTDGGYVDVKLFYNWLSTAPMTIPLFDELTGGIGGADGFAVFNHPGDKKISNQDPAYNWNNFEFSAKAEPFMVGMELFNAGDDYGSGDHNFYSEALDKGWHIGAIASEDHHGYDWNNASDGKTVFVADALNEESFRKAMKARSFYAVRDHGLRMDYTAGTESMGSQLLRKTGSVVALNAEIFSDNVEGLELVSNSGTVLSTVKGKRLKQSVPVSETEQWYYIRAVNAEGRSMAYSSPIWVKGGGTIVDETTGIAENRSTETSLFPNPLTSGTELQARFNHNATVQYTLTDVSGRIVLNGINTVEPGINTLLTPAQTQLTPGLYFLQMEENGFLSRQQILVR
ncbi:MAG: CehA/McbA family metallohydrolase [Bacteroidota bacterium]